MSSTPMAPHTGPDEMRGGGQPGGDGAGTGGSSLSPVEQRVLGALMEKQQTVPAGYPLTMAALRAACNQTSSREPVTDLDEQTVHLTVAELRSRELVRFVHTGSGSRTVRFHQRLTEQLALDEASTALLTVVLLRGPQSAGQLLTRTERLHAFEDRAAVEAHLASIAALDAPWVAELEHQAGQRDPRWAHTLGPVDESAPVPVLQRVDRNAVLNGGGDLRDARVRTGYDAMATGYTQALHDELAGKPFDRWVLDRVDELTPAGPVLDVGCGPGQVAAYLAERGRAASGIDLSPAMIEEARSLHPDLDLHVGDLRGLLKPRDAAGWSAVTAWYALVHLAGSELADTLREFVRVLVPGGVVALALHIGDEIRHVTELFGADVDLHFVLHDRHEILRAATAAGLVDVQWYLRGPDPAVEVETERLYLIGRTTAG
ncbi:MAG: DUF480 domain-containing protein [Nakamurella sp.]